MNRLITWGIIAVLLFPSALVSSEKLTAVPVQAASDGLRLSLSQASSQSVRLIWNIWPGAVSYEIYRANIEDSQGELIQTVPVAGQDTSLSYEDAELSRGYTYYYTVLGRNETGEQVCLSDQKEIYISGKPERPILKITRKKSRLTFSVSGTDGAEGIYLYGKTKGGKYKLYQASIASYAWFPSSGSSFQMKIASRRATYHFKVRSYALIRGKKVYSSYSDPVTVKITA